MGHWKMLLAAMLAVLALSLAAAPSFAVDVNAGPIWDNNDAQGKCPNICGGRDNWDGNWRTTEFGRMSVCSCRAAANFTGGQSSSQSSTSSCSIAAQGACRACSAMCADGRQAQCAGGQSNGNSCAVPARCGCQ